MNIHMSIYAYVCIINRTSFDVVVVVVCDNFSICAIPTKIIFALEIRVINLIKSTSNNISHIKSTSSAHQAKYIVNATLTHDVGKLTE